MTNIDTCGAAILSIHCTNPEEYTWFKQVRVDEPRILLLQRGATAPTFPECWAFPAGIREEGESLEQAVRRETKEEVGVTFKPRMLFFSGAWKNRHLHYYTGEWKAPKALRPQINEVAGYGWFSFKDALGLPLAFRYREVIKNLVTMY